MYAEMGALCGAMGSFVAIGRNVLKRVGETPEQKKNLLATTTCTTVIMLLHFPFSVSPASFQFRSGYL